MDAVEDGIRPDLDFFPATGVPLDGRGGPASTARGESEREGRTLESRRHTAEDTRGDQARLKNWTARSCFFAAASVENVPRFLRPPVFGSFLRESSR